MCLWRDLHCGAFGRAGFGKRCRCWLVHGIKSLKGNKGGGGLVCKNMRKEREIRRGAKKQHQQRKGSGSIPWSYRRDFVGGGGKCTACGEKGSYGNRPVAQLGFASFDRGATLVETRRSRAQLSQKYEGRTGSSAMKEGKVGESERGRGRGSTLRKATCFEGGGGDEQDELIKRRIGHYSTAYQEQEVQKTAYG